MTTPDHFPGQSESATGGSRRPTMPTVGGIRRPSAREIAGGLAAGPRRPEIDERASAAVERFWAERFGRKVRLSGSGQAPASGPAWISMRGPDDGFSWNVRRLNVGPIDYTAVPYAAGVTTIAVVGSQQQPGANVVSADQAASVTTSWPAEGTWGPGELTLEGGDWLWIAVIGLASGTQITAGGQALQTAAGVPEIYGL